MIWKQPLRWIPQKVEVSCIQVKAWNLMVCLWKNFGTEDQNFIEKEDVSAQREQRLEEQRIRELAKKAFWAAWGPFMTWNSCFWGVLLVLLVICLIVSQESYAIAWSTLLWTRGLVTWFVKTTKNAHDFFPQTPPSVRWRLNEAEAKEAKSARKRRSLRNSPVLPVFWIERIWHDFCWFFHVASSISENLADQLQQITWGHWIFHNWLTPWPQPVPRYFFQACSSKLKTLNEELRRSKVDDMKFDILLDWWSHKNQPFM